MRDRTELGLGNDGLRLLLSLCELLNASLRVGGAGHRRGRVQRKLEARPGAILGPILVAELGAILVKMGGSAKNFDTSSGEGRPAAGDVNVGQRHRRQLLSGLSCVTSVTYVLLAPSSPHASALARAHRRV